MDPSSPLNWTLINEMANALTDEQKEEAELRFANTGKVTREEFKVAIACLFALASVVFIGRIIIRLASRRRLYKDDLLLVLSFSALCSATAIFYHTARRTYLLFALMRGDFAATLIASQEIESVYNHLNWSFPYLICLWTSIFMVKLCYFAFFHTLLKSMPQGLLRFYWVSVIFTILAWLFLCLQPLISCPYFGKSSAKCFPTLPVSKTVMDFTFWIGPVLDAVTDILLITIPIMVLRKSQMTVLAKISFGVFLCLSVFMLACSITRAAGTYYGNSLDTPWQVFWLHAEACIGVFMASITVYRSLLLGSYNTPSAMQRLLEKAIHIRTSERFSEQEQVQTRRGQFGRFLLSKIPTATLTGLGTMFGVTWHPQQSGDLITVDSAFELTETDYHEHLKALNPGAPPSRIATTTAGSYGTSTIGQDSMAKPSASPELPEPQRPRSTFSALLLRAVVPRSHRTILQHRTYGLGDTGHAA